MIVNPRRLARATTFLTCALAVVVLLAGTSPAHADPESWATTTAVPPGGTLSINETVPNVNIASSNTIAGCSLQGLNTDFIVYTCDPSGSGIPTGTQMTQTFAAPTGGSVSQNVPESVTYNANGPMAGRPAGSSESSAACKILFDNTVPPDTYPPGDEYANAIVGDCRVSTNAATVSGETLLIHVSHRPWDGFQPGDIDIQSSPATLGTCPVNPVTKPPVTSHGPGTDAQIVYICASGQSIPSGTTVDLTVFGQWHNGGTIQEDPSRIAADVGLAAAPAIPAPTTQALFGVNPPLLLSIDPAIAEPGTTVTLSGTDLRTFAVSFGGTPGGSSALGPSGGTTVSFGTVAAGNVACDSSGTTCTATVPAGDPGTIVSVTVTNSAGTSNGQPFGYAPPPSSRTMAAGS
jgi:hypothetical protein